MRALPWGLATLLISGSAFASPGITAYNGKPSASGDTSRCTTVCHAAAGAAPTLDINVPTAMKAGETGAVTVVVKGTGERDRTSLSASFSNGVKASKGQNTEVPFPDVDPGDVAAVIPPPSGRNGTYKFSFVAPNRNGPISLWIAGMSASGQGSGGDGAAYEKRTIMISGATEMPEEDAGSSSGNTSSSGSPSSSSSSSSGTPSEEPGSSSGDDEPGSTSSSSGRPRRLGSSDDSGGCSLAGSPVDLGVLAPPALVALTLLAARRRRR